MLLHLWSKEKSSEEVWHSFGQRKIRFTFHRYAKNLGLNKEKIWIWVSSLSCSWNLSCCNFSLIQRNFAISFQISSPYKRWYSARDYIFYWWASYGTRWCQFHEKRSSHSLWNLTWQSTKSSSLLTPRAPGWHDNITESPQRSSLQSLWRLPQRWPAQTTSFLAASHAWPASTSPTRPARPTLLKANRAMPST